MKTVLFCLAQAKAPAYRLPAVGRAGRCGYFFDLEFRTPQSEFRNC